MEKYNCEFNFIARKELIAYLFCCSVCNWYATFFGICRVWSPLTQDWSSANSNSVYVYRKERSMIYFYRCLFLDRVRRKRTPRRRKFITSILASSFRADNAPHDTQPWLSASFCRFYLLVLGQILATRASIYGRFHLDVSTAKYRAQTEAEESWVESSERNLEQVPWLGNM